jgi:hypothetical protein
MDGKGVAPSPYALVRADFELSDDAAGGCGAMRRGLYVELGVAPGYAGSEGLRFPCPSTVGL